MKHKNHVGSKPSALDPGLEGTDPNIPRSDNRSSEQPLQHIIITTTERKPRTLFQRFTEERVHPRAQAQLLRRFLAISAQSDN